MFYEMICQGSIILQQNTVGEQRINWTSIYSHTLSKTVDRNSITNHKEGYWLVDLNRYTSLIYLFLIVGGLELSDHFLFSQIFRVWGRVLNREIFDDWFHSSSVNAHISLSHHWSSIGFPGQETERKIWSIEVLERIEEFSKLTWTWFELFHHLCLLLSDIHNCKNHPWKTWLFLTNHQIQFQEERSSCFLHTRERACWLRKMLGKQKIEFMRYEEMSSPIAVGTITANLIISVFDRVI